MPTCPTTCLPLSTIFYLPAALFSLPLPYYLPLLLPLPVFSHLPFFYLLHHPCYTCLPISTLYAILFLPCLTMHSPFSIAASSVTCAPYASPRDVAHMLPRASTCKTSCHAISDRRHDRGGQDFAACARCRAFAAFVLRSAPLFRLCCLTLYAPLPYTGAGMHCAAHAAYRGAGWPICFARAAF